MARLVEEPERGLEAMNDVATLRLISAFVVEGAKAVYHADVPGLRQERVVVDEAPQREEAVDAARFVVITEDARYLQHARTSISNGVCLTASYRVRNLDDESRMRSI